MARRSHTIIPYSRDYRPPPRFNMGLPPPRRSRVWDPKVYLRALMAVAALGLVVLPFGADTVTAALGPSSQNGCRVVSVVDGDTVRLWCSGRGLMKARLKGFDAPEVFSPSCLSELTSGMAATWHLRWILLRARAVTVGFAGEDRYGRALVSIAADGRPVAGRMIAAGYARPYDGGVRAGWCAT